VLSNSTLSRSAARRIASEQLNAHQLIEIGARTYLHVVLPTPPFPPTKIHFNDF
jgi:hypothetical protein